MASPLQQQSFQRKIIYIVAMLVLFFATYMMRENPTYGIDAQSRRLKIQEQSLGEVELTGSAVRLMLTGSRGFAVCALWMTAQDMQKKHYWSELELLVDSITKLQPHFITPWLFQSWNLAYNVSVESDRIRDKYFYITRGIQLLTDGERKNDNNPDMRFAVGFYNQHKIGVSDEATTFRCLFQMSCMDPVDRDPSRLKSADGRGIDKERLAEFCRRYPFLVRRLKEVRKLTKPEEIVDFLAENQKIPSRYQDVKQSEGTAGVEARTPLKPEDQRYPVISPIDDREKGDPNTPEFDNFTCARDWYAYANRCLPPPDPTVLGSPENYDRTKYRIPRAMAINIFRGYPGRAETYVAEYQQKEGWFDREGWLIRGEGWFEDDRFPRSTEPAVVGNSRDWSRETYGKAFALYQELGKGTGMYIDPVTMAQLEKDAEVYRREAGIMPGEPSPPGAAGGKAAQLEAGRIANDRLMNYETYRRMTNYPHFYATTRVESEDATIRLRKEFFLAKQAKEAGERDLAIELYRGAFPKLRDIMLKPENLDFRIDDSNLENTYETVLKYTDLIQDRYGKDLRELMLLQNFLTQAATPGSIATPYFPPVYAVREVPLGIGTALDFADSKGPLLPPALRNAVMQRENRPTFIQMEAPSPEVMQGRGEPGMPPSRPGDRKQQ